MAEQWQIRRGTKTQNDTFTGAEGEITMDTTNKTIRIHDGTTAGGTTITTNSDIQTLLNSIYEIGSVYIGTQSVCPMIALIPGSTWELVSSDKALWTGDGTNANTTIEAGLPNITGSFSTASDQNLGTGAFSWTTDKYSTNGGGQGGQWGINFSAQNSNSIYGNSTTVQPPAYVVNVWRRTA